MCIRDSSWDMRNRSAVSNLDLAVFSKPSHERGFQWKDQAVSNPHIQHFLRVWSSETQYPLSGNSRVRTHPYLSLFSLFYIPVKIGALKSPYFRDRGDFGLICPYFLGCRTYSFWPIDLRFCMNVANRLIILGASFVNKLLNSFLENIDLPKLLGKRKSEIWNNKVRYIHFAVNFTFWG